jgi:hypothetical protein
MSTSNSLLHIPFNVPIPDYIENTYSQYRITLIASLIAGTIFLITLAWNDVVQEIISYYYPKKSRESIRDKIYYALYITIFVVLLQIYVFPYISTSSRTK